MQQLQMHIKRLNEGEAFPLANTGRGDDISPEIKLTGLTSDAQTLAITLEDLTHPIRNFTHWVIWNIPATDTIPAAIPAGKTVASLDGAKQGIAYGMHRYAGPKPPEGKQHRYRFTVYVLDCELDLSANSTKRKFLEVAEGHILQQASIAGVFEAE